MMARRRGGDPKTATASQDFEYCSTMTLIPPESCKKKSAKIPQPVHVGFIFSEKKNPPIFECKPRKFESKHPCLRVWIL